MAADQPNPTDAHMTLLAPLPDHQDVQTRSWQELWRRHTHITTPLRERGLPCDIEFGLSAHIVRVTLPDDSYLIISPPQDPPSDHSPGDPEGWIATREDPDDETLFEVVYDSLPSEDPGADPRPEARHGGSAEPLIEAIDHRLTQLGLLPAPRPAPHKPSPGPDPADVPSSGRDRRTREWRHLCLRRRAARSDRPAQRSRVTRGRRRPPAPDPSTHRRSAGAARRVLRSSR